MDDLHTLIKKIRQDINNGQSVAYVSGYFNVLHPGHLRLLKFAAECADILIVGVYSDQEQSALITEELRLQAIQSIGYVRHALILPCKNEQFIELLEPDFVVKGKEHQTGFNPEAEIIKNYGGKLLFSSGESRFSSIDLLKKELEVDHSNIQKPHDYLNRHQISASQLSEVVQRFKTLNVIVIGDLIIDEYITCDPLGMSQEDPTIVVTPIKRDIFIGGAGIVACHAAGLGAKVSYFGIVGNDPLADFAQKKLEASQIQAFLIADSSRPTTLKQRYRAHNKTLLRVSELKQHAIDEELINKILEQIKPILSKTDILFFSDFNYGCLPLQLIHALTELCRQYDVTMVADSQSSSQIGDISKYQHTMLITPTEHEARIALQDTDSGLPILAEKLTQKTNTNHVFVTLGSEGMFAFSSHNTPFDRDQLPALNHAPKDVSGAGDSLFTTAAMALKCGASIWEAAYLGSVSAACQVGRLGNLPLSSQDLYEELTH